MLTIERYMQELLCHFTTNVHILTICKDTNFLKETIFRSMIFLQFFHIAFHIVIFGYSNKNYYFCWTLYIHTP